VGGVDGISSEEAAATYRHRIAEEK